MNEIIKQITANRQTVKKYSDKKISDEDWKQVLEMIYWSPSSHGFEPYRVLVINKGNELRNELQPLMWGQTQVIEADKLVFFISMTREAFTNEDWLYERALRMAQKVNGFDGEKAEVAAKKHTEVIKNLHLGKDELTDDWSMKQTYIALSSAMIGATILNIGSTPMEGFERSKVEELFRQKGLITNNEKVSVVAAFGYLYDNTSYAHYGSGKRVRDEWDVKFKEV